MINLISSSGDKRAKRGPAKVFTNLVKGLDRIGYPYVINRDLNATKRLWIQDSISALYEMRRSKANKVLGPNLFVLPREIPAGITFEGALYLQPSDWAKEVWERAGFAGCPTVVWPVGIDTEVFKPLHTKKRDGHVLVYHKLRDPEQLQQIMSVLEKMRLPNKLMRYGEYDDGQYLEALQEASLVIWHGRHESQGIALEEALACDVPALVCDARRLSDARESFVFPASLDDIQVTSAPYFGPSCGLKILDLAELPEAIQSMLENQRGFSPRQFVLDHLSLEQQARAFIQLWNYWDLTFEQGLVETVQNERDWKPGLGARARLRLERGIRSVVKKSV